MGKNIYFTPGPSGLYFTVEQHIKAALLNQVAEESHRSQAFSNIVQETVENLKTLLNVPTGYHIAFTGSATEIWERSIQNLVKKESYHLVNGSFSSRFHSIASELGLNAVAQKVDAGECPDWNDIVVSEDTELIAITQNETSTGVGFPLEDIYKIRDKFPDQLLAVDMVSSTPYIDLDLSKVDLAYFSVQKCFGLPAGLGVWIYNDRCLDIAVQHSNKGAVIGTYHSLPSLHKYMKKFQTPETPNMLTIYLLGKVAKDMIDKGIVKIRQETDYKSAVLYNLYDNHNALSAFVQDKRVQSKTVAVAEVNGGSTPLIDYLKSFNMVIGSGYGSFKKEHIRIANFPTHSKEQIEMLVDKINLWS